MEKKHRNQISIRKEKKTQFCYTYKQLNYYIISFFNLASDDS